MGISKNGGRGIDSEESQACFHEILDDWSELISVEIVHVIGCDLVSSCIIIPSSAPQGTCPYFGPAWLMRNWQLFGQILNRMNPDPLI